MKEGDMEKTGKEDSIYPKIFERHSTSLILREMQIKHTEIKTSISSSIAKRQVDSMQGQHGHCLMV